MTETREVLRRAMVDAGVSQSRLALLSGVRQPSISQVLAGTTGLSDPQLERLLACMGLRLEVERRAVVADLTRSELRSWRLHRQLATHLSATALDDWLPKLADNLRRLAVGVQGEPHVGNVEEWAQLIASRDVGRVRRVMTGLDRHDIEMREVSPLSGLLPDDERIRALQGRH